MSSLVHSVPSADELVTIGPALFTVAKRFPPSFAVVGRRMIGERTLIVRRLLVERSSGFAVDLQAEGSACRVAMVEPSCWDHS